MCVFRYFWRTNVVLCKCSGNVLIGYSFFIAGKNGYIPSLPETPGYCLGVETILINCKLRKITKPPRQIPFKKPRQINIHNKEKVIKEDKRENENEHENE